MATCVLLIGGLEYWSVGALEYWAASGIHHSITPPLHYSLSPYRAQRLLYWNRLRAPGWPYFLRSLMRESRVSNPSALSTGRRLASAVSNARAKPCRTAPAWPLAPPLWTEMCAATCSAVPATVKGWAAIMRRDSMGQ